MVHTYNNPMISHEPHTEPKTKEGSRRHLLLRILSFAVLSAVVAVGAYFAQAQSTADDTIGNASPARSANTTPSWPISLTPVGVICKGPWPTRHSGPHAFSTPPAHHPPRATRGQLHASFPPGAAALFWKVRCKCAPRLPRRLRSSTRRAPAPAISRDAGSCRGA